MKKIKFFCSAILTIALIVLLSSSAKAQSTNKVIIVYNDFVTEQVMTKMNMQYDIQAVKKLNAIHGQSGVVSQATLQSLKVDSRVKYVANDDIVTMYKPAPAVVPETLPWGIDTVNAEQVWTEFTGLGVKVAILDTGIDMDHPDLVGNIKGGINMIDTSISFDDDNGHGTHVAGTIAAVDNEIGVIGVAPQADLYGVKVLNRRGSGATSDIIAGIEWAVQNNMDLISMSLGSAVYNLAFEEAINFAYNNGVIVVCAAGNESTVVSYPAAYDNAIAVSAIDSSLNFASFSNFGPEIDVTAPGVSIYSTYYKGQYTTMSGTSMATPHVTGIIALMLQAGTASTLEEVRAKFATGCVDLGTPGYDIYYGYGLVDATLLTQ